MTVLGAMSGSSLDGLDLAIIQFERSSDSNIPHWEMVRCKTIPYLRAMQEQLKAAPSMSAQAQYLLDARFGQYIASLIDGFLLEGEESLDLIGWHGHTVYHDPAHKTSLQIGKGAAIAAVTGTDVICDFRLMDLNLGGQGAPLAPLVDLELMPKATFYTNLGGICNLSMRWKEGKIKAGDLSVCNQLLNFVSEQLGKPYDEGGAMARKGNLIPELRAALNDLLYHHQDFPKSMDNNWVAEKVLPQLLPYLDQPQDVLHTGVMHIVDQLEIVTRRFDSLGGDMICTGGGAKNTFLIEKLSARLAPHRIEVILPDTQIIDYKEALLMAYMAYCYRHGRRNILSSATGAARDSIGGCLHLATNPAGHA